MDLAQSRQHVETQPVAREAAVEVGLVLAPLEPGRRAVLAGLVAGQVEQRPDQASAAPAHAQQRPPAGRRDQPVEDRLDLVGRRVAGGDPVESLALADPLGRLVARLPRARLEVAAIGHLDALDLQLDAERSAQLGAEALVVRRLRRAGRG